MKRSPLGYAAIAAALIVMGAASWYTSGDPVVHGLTLLVSAFFVLWVVTLSRKKFVLAGRTLGTIIHQETIQVPSQRLLISQAERREASDPVLSVPMQVTAFVEVVTRSFGQTVRSIRLEGKTDNIAPSKETQKICVGGGTLFFGDCEFADELWKTPELNRETLKLFEPDAIQPYVLFREKDDAKALVVVTGEGDDWYDIDIEVAKEGAFSLSTRFPLDGDIIQQTDAKE